MYVGEVLCPLLPETCAGRRVTLNAVACMPRAADVRRQKGNDQTRHKHSADEPLKRVWCAECGVWWHWSPDALQSQSLQSLQKLRTNFYHPGRTAAAAPLPQNGGQRPGPKPQAPGPRPQAQDSEHARRFSQRLKGRWGASSGPQFLHDHV